MGGKQVWTGRGYVKCGNKCLSVFERVARDRIGVHTLGGGAVADGATGRRRLAYTPSGAARLRTPQQGGPDWWLG